ncbi:MAG: GH1 family beta-glucosidase [Ferruginibacter sp.]
MAFKKEDFGNDFIWGVSTAAYQIEGAHDADDKGPSIWDEFSQKKKKISGDHNGNIACDFYNRYEDDIDLMHQLNIRHYRFSISWSRLLPSGAGEVNPKGIDFYNRVIDHCLALNITPWITLYHWDLPAALQKKGGWTNRDVINWFSFFVRCCVKNFGDRVKHWMILNEPMVFTGAGYFLGVHAPGKKGLANFLAAVHHAAMCQSEGGRIIRTMCSDCKIGTTISYSHIEPFSNSLKDTRAAKKVDALLNRMFLEPLLGLGYPTAELKILQRIERFMHPGDEKQLAFDMDFIGLQNYTREVVKHAPFTPFVQAKIIKADQRNAARTLMNWEIHPPSIFEALKRVSSYSGVNEIIITENGAAFTDEVINGNVQDDQRVDFLKAYIRQVLLTKQQGAKVNGYFVWTLLDNFEWAEGFHPRFGLVHVNFETQERIIKASGKWYRDFISRYISSVIL